MLALLRVAPLLPSPTLRAVLGVMPGRDGKAGSLIELERSMFFFGARVRELISAFAEATEAIVASDPRSRARVLRKRATDMLNGSRRHEGRSHFGKVVITHS
jgi:hypothetical protein